MKTVYIDKNEMPGATSLWMKNVEIKWAGVVIYSMSVKDKDENYQRYEEKHDIQFIFDDKRPNIDFFTVPMVEIFAIDSEGGSIGSVGEGVDLESTAPICYISKNKECFLIAESFKHLTNNPQNWKQNMESYYEIEIFSSKEDAEKKFEFLDIKEIQDYKNRKNG